MQSILRKPMGLIKKGDVFGIEDSDAIAIVKKVNRK
jgi:hypothetical protein